MAVYRIHGFIAVTVLMSGGCGCNTGCRSVGYFVERVCHGSGVPAKGGLLC